MRQNVKSKKSLKDVKLSYPKVILGVLHVSGPVQRRPKQQGSPILTPHATQLPAKHTNVVGSEQEEFEQQVSPVLPHGPGSGTQILHKVPNLYMCERICLNKQQSSKRQEDI